MKRRDFLRRLAGAAAAPIALAVGLAKPKPDIHTEMARRCFGTVTGRTQSKIPNLSNVPRSLMPHQVRAFQKVWLEYAIPRWRKRSPFKILKGIRA